MEISRPKPWQTWPEDKARRVYKGKVYEVYEWDQEQFDGSRKTFEIVKRKDCVSVIPITHDGKIMLTEEVQPGVEPFISVPGGAIDDGESPRQASERELLEESGYAAGSYELWYACQFMPRMDRAYYTFIAKGLEKKEELKLEAGERIRLRFVTFNEFIKIAAQENYRDRDISWQVFKSLNNPEEYARMRRLFSA